MNKVLQDNIFERIAIIILLDLLYNIAYGKKFESLKFLIISV